MGFQWVSRSKTLMAYSQMPRIDPVNCLDHRRSTFSVCWFIIMMGITLSERTDLFYEHMLGVE